MQDSVMAAQLVAEIRRVCPEALKPDGGFSLDLVPPTPMAMSAVPGPERLLEVLRTLPDRAGMAAVSTALWPVS